MNNIININLSLIILVSISCSGGHSDNSISKQKNDKQGSLIEDQTNKNKKRDNIEINYCNILKKDIGKLLNKWNRPVKEIKCSYKKDKLELTLDFRSSYITVGSQHFIISMLFYKKFDTFKKLSNVEFTNYVSDDGYFNRTYSEKMIYNQFENWKGRKRFYNYAVYSLKNMSPEEIISCNVIIERTHNAKPHYIDNYKNYWFLLDAFTKDCHKKDSEAHKEFENFYLGSQWEKSDVPSQVIKHIFTTCGE